MKISTTCFQTVKLHLAMENEEISTHNLPLICLSIPLLFGTPSIFLIVKVYYNHFLLCNNNIHDCLDLNYFYNHNFFSVHVILFFAL